MTGSSLRTLFALLAVAATVGFLASAADARVGGGASSGSRGGRTFSAPPTTTTAPSTAAPIQRTITQPATAARPAAPAAQPGGFLNRPGLLGGLAAGFIGAGLFGMLFGHGLGGGLGGIASFLGLILQLGLIALVAMLVWRWWQNRSQPAYAGGPSMRDMGSTGMGATGMAAMPGGAGAASASQNIEITSADFDTFERVLGEIQTAYSAEDINGLRARATPEMVSYFSEQLAESASRGEVNQISGVKLLQGDLSEAWREDGAEYATVAMRFSLIDRTVERASGRLVDGSNDPQEVAELWTFMRARGGNWLLSAIQQT